MRLTVHTDYSLRLLIYLAIRQDVLVTIDEIAAAYGISRNHLAKVAHTLGVAGHVETVQGRNGGLRLAHPPEAIGVGDVIRSTEPDLAFVPCLALDTSCPIQYCCTLRRAMLEARAAFPRTVLDGYSVADLTKPRAPLAAAAVARAAAPPRRGQAQGLRQDGAVARRAGAIPLRRHLPRMRATGYPSPHPPGPSGLSPRGTDGIVRDGAPGAAGPVRCPSAADPRDRPRRAGGRGHQRRP